jgi:hypothetical protein
MKKGASCWRQLILVSGLATLAGCATPYTAPQGQATDLARIRVQQIDKGIGEIVIAKVDGQKVRGSAGALLPGEHILRITKYPPVGMNWMFGLLGAWSMEMDSVSRDLSFAAERNVEYVVRYSEDAGLPPGKMGVVTTSSIKRRFWIEDAKTGKTVVQKN